MNFAASRRDEGARTSPADRQPIIIPPLDDLMRFPGSNDIGSDRGDRSFRDPVNAGQAAASQEGDSIEIDEHPDVFLVPKVEKEEREEIPDEDYMSDVRNKYIVARERGFGMDIHGPDFK